MDYELRERLEAVRAGRSLAATIHAVLDVGLEVAEAEPEIAALALDLLADDCE